MKISTVTAQLYDENWRTGGQTDMTKLTVAFRNFANASENKPLPRIALMVNNLKLSHILINSIGIIIQICTIKINLHYT